MRYYRNVPSVWFSVCKETATISMCCPTSLKLCDVGTFCWKAVLHTSYWIMVLLRRIIGSSTKRMNKDSDYRLRHIIILVLAIAVEIEMWASIKSNEQTLRTQEIKFRIKWGICLRGKYKKRDHTHWNDWKATKR